LVDPPPPFAVLGLAQRKARAKVAAAAAAKAGYLIGGVARLDQFARDRNRQLLARFGLPDHEAAAGILARPARIALAVLGDLVPAHRTRPELGPRDPHVLQLRLELPDGLLGEAGDVAHEVLARVLPALDLAEAMLPAARQAGRGERVRVQQPDHVQALLGGHQRPRVALQVGNLDQALDDRRAGGRAADARGLHRLAELIVLHQLAGGLHGPQERRVAVAPRRLGFLALARDVNRVDLLAALQLRQLLVGILLLALGARVGDDLVVDPAPA